MPSFYPGDMPSSQFPPTPEYPSKYSFDGYSCVQENGFPQYPSAAFHDLSAYGAEPFDAYKAVATPSATLFPSSNVFAGNNALPGMSGRSATTGPPHTQSRSSADGYQHRSRRAGDITNTSAPPNRKAKDVPVVGGVSAILDYEMETMTQFVAEMAVGIIQPSSQQPQNFRKWVLHVLNATRLPSATILTSLHYLSLRLRYLSSDASTTAFHASDMAVYPLLTVALILGSKFLDDNTFQNKSWAEVSNISVPELNREERAWLASFEHRLHYHPSCPGGFNHWQDQWTRFQARAASTPSILRPLDTNVQRQRSVRISLSHPPSRQNSSPTDFAKQYATVPSSTFVERPMESQYPTPGHTTYDPWFPQCSRLDSSPASAPHTGPATPEYYAPQNIWAPDYRALPLGFASMPPVMAQGPPSAYHHASYPLPYAEPYMWNAHGPGCMCARCPRYASHYLHTGRYGPSVAG